MERKLRVSTKAEAQESEEELEPVSPTTGYFLTKGIKCFILCFFESEVPIDVPSLHDFTKNIFCKVHPRLFSIAVEDKRGNKKWKRVEVNVEDHIIVPKFAEGLSLEEYSMHFDEYTLELGSSQLAQDKPLWEAHIFNYPTENSSGTIILKFHHAVADGISLMGILFSSLQRVDDPTIPLTFPSSTTKSISRQMENDSFLHTIMKVFKLVPESVASIFRSFYYFGQNFRLAYFEDDRTPIRSGITNDDIQYKICRVTLSLHDVKRIKTILGVTVNDVVVGIIILAIRLYMRGINQGDIKKTRSTMVIALNSREAKGYARPEEMRKDNSKVPWGNRFAGIDLPITNLDEDDFTNPIKFIMEAHNEITRKKNTPLAQLLFGCYIGLVGAFGGLQATEGIIEGRSKNSSLLLSNMIGPTEKMSFAGHPIKGFYFIPTGVNWSLTVSVMSYMQMLTIGLAFEKGFIDHQAISSCIEKAFQLIMQAATTTIAQCIILGTS